MKEIGIQKIEKNHPFYKVYKRRIEALKRMNKNISFPVNDSFYAIYMGEFFVAAGNFSFDRETSELNVTLLNDCSSTGYNEVMVEATKLLTDIANETYGVKKIGTM